MPSSEVMLAVQFGVIRARLSVGRSGFRSAWLARRRGLGDGVLLLGDKVGPEVVRVEGTADDLFDCTVVEVDTRSEYARHSFGQGVSCRGENAFKLELQRLATEIVSRSALPCRLALPL